MCVDESKKGDKKIGAPSAFGCISREPQIFFLIYQTTVKMRDDSTHALPRELRPIQHTGAVLEDPEPEQARGNMGSIADSRRVGRRRKERKKKKN
jgi:hypothetical protein